MKLKWKLVIVAVSALLVVSAFSGGVLAGAFARWLMEALR